MLAKTVAEGGSGKAPASRRGRSARTTSSEHGSETGSAPPSPLQEVRRASGTGGDASAWIGDLGQDVKDALLAMITQACSHHGGMSTAARMDVRAKFGITMEQVIAAESWIRTASGEEGDVDSDAASIDSGTASSSLGRPSRRRSVVRMAAQALGESDESVPPAASKGRPLRTPGT